MRSSGDEIVLHPVELALLTIGTLKLHIRAGVLDGLGGLAGKEPQPPEVVVGEGTPLCIVEDVQDANNLPPLDQRDGNHRTELLALVNSGMRGVSAVVVYVESLPHLCYLTSEPFARVQAVSDVVTT